MSLMDDRSTRHIRSVQGQFVVLRLSQAAATPRPAREFRIADGKLVHRASGDRKESAEEMSVALLARMKRADAAPALAKMCLRGSTHIRWHALRSCLSLDTQLGFDTLSQIAREESDPLSAPAGALRAQLLEAHPQLLALEEA